MIFFLKSHANRAIFFEIPQIQSINHEHSLKVLQYYTVHDIIVLINKYYSYNFENMAQKFLPSGHKLLLATGERAPRVPTLA